jgi:hypothetical protein
MQAQQVALDQDFQSQTYDVNKIFQEFAKPIFNNSFFNNLATLRINSDFIDFNVDRWYQRPTVFCLDIYKEPKLFQVILLVNNIKSFLEFTPDYFPKVGELIYAKHVIIAPYRSEIRKVLSFV